MSATAVVAKLSKQFTACVYRKSKLSFEESLAQLAYRRRKCVQAHPKFRKAPHSDR